MLRTFANKRDRAEPEIVDALRKAGCLVYRLDKPCDLICCYRGSVYLVEIKTGKRGKLTKAQESFRAIWPLHVIRDVDEALETLKTWAFVARAAA